MVYNCRLFDYPEGKHVTVYHKSITRQEKDKENIKPKNENFVKSYKNEDRTAEAEEHCKNVSLSATKNRIYNIARSNTWDWFITLTFKRDNIDASDYDVVTHKLHYYLNNLQKRKCPDLKYLIVPELHTDKTNYHFHGLISGAGNLRFCFSGLFDKHDRPIYNILDWSYGFTTATQIEDNARSCSYITKYVTKDTDLKLKNKKRYMCSRNVERTAAEFFVVDEQDFIEVYGEDITYAKNVKVPQAYQSINYYEIQE